MPSTWTVLLDSVSLEFTHTHVGYLKMGFWRELSLQQLIVTMSLSLLIDSASAFPSASHARVGAMLLAICISHGLLSLFMALYRMSQASAATPEGI